MPLRKTCILTLFPALYLGAIQSGEQADADELVEKAFSYYRDDASVARVRMTIQRPDWKRVQIMHAWTLGENQSLFTTIEPSRDKGNGTLKKDGDMWTYNPKVNRIIKLPPSMMAQAWMGSDFSNNDLAKADSIIRNYTHTLLDTSTIDGQTVYTVESIPYSDAPVVWGKQILKIREDLVFLEERFHDEEGKLVKTLYFEDIEEISGKLYPRTMRMQPAVEPDQHTTVTYLDLTFPDSLPDWIFTRSSLRSPPDPEFQ
ncbi:MAG TPA: outer membrane lipoprotein-sorting protein [Oceanipulchritudo sp.]|nr:outer membrane lipoprotein-sorting protein [Oceanipulchritudo sp.]